jgi:hypothetical protein
MRYKNMKPLITTILLSTLFVLASCKATIQAPQIQDRTPDVLKKSTPSMIINPTIVDVPKDTIVTTGEGKRISVIVEEDTKVTVAKGLFDLSTPDEVVLPKHTEVTIPPETQLKTIDSVKVTMESGIEVIIPAGTEITTTKINWYGVLFYTVLILGAGWYYLHIRRQPEDKNKDGYVDEDKVMVGKKKIVNKRKQ